MSRPVAVLRPEPGNSATCARLCDAGREAIALPLFHVVARPWDAPDPAQFDAMILTSANAVRHAGPLLHQYTALPAYAVGAQTARAAAAAGFGVAATGRDNAAALLAMAEAAGVRRALHLGGAATTVTPGGIVATSRTVYASNALDHSAATLTRLSGATALLHSARAAARLAELCAAHAMDRSTIALAAISPAAAAAAGAGWAGIAIAAQPDDTSLIAAAD